MPSTTRKSRTKVKPEPVKARVEKIRVDPITWNAALELAGGDAKRIEVVSAFECVVHNPGWRAGR